MKGQGCQRVTFVTFCHFLKFQSLFRNFCHFCHFFLKKVLVFAILAVTVFCAPVISLLNPFFPLLFGKILKYTEKPAAPLKFVNARNFSLASLATF